MINPNPKPNPQEVGTLDSQIERLLRCEFLPENEVFSVVLRVRVCKYGENGGESGSLLYFVGQKLRYNGRKSGNTLDSFR
jgi:hypothetical protein